MKMKSSSVEIEFAAKKSHPSDPKLPNPWSTMFWRRSVYAESLQEYSFVFENARLVESNQMLLEINLKLTD